jgi:hypothetical protein
MGSAVESRERLFWLRVILRTQEEADGRHLYDADANKLRRRAQKYLTKDSKSLRRVCDLAGFTKDRYCQFLKMNKEKYARAM